MTSLHSDENFSDAVVAELQRFGYDVLTARAAGRANRGILDVDVLAFATSQGRAVVTHDGWCFIRLHRQGIAHAGIIVCTYDSDAPALAARIHREITARSKLNDQLIRIIRPAKP